MKFEIYVTWTTSEATHLRIVLLLNVFPSRTKLSVRKRNILFLCFFVQNLPKFPHNQLVNLESQKLIRAVISRINKRNLSVRPAPPEEVETSLDTDLVERDPPARIILFLMCYARMILYRPHINSKFKRSGSKIVQAMSHLEQEAVGV